MKQTLEQIVKFFIYLTFFVPLVLVPSSFIFPFIVPKILLFRSLTMLILGGYGLLLLINWQEYKPKFTPLNIAAAAFLLSFALSTFFGVDAYHSFWDNHERMLGLFTIFHYVAYYLVCSSVFKNWREWSIALKIFLLAGSIVMFIGVLQRGNPYLLLNQGSDRVASTLGNAIYVGGYGLFLFFVALLLFVREKSTAWRGAEAIAGFLALLGLIFSGTRGSLLGLLVGLGGALVAYAVLMKNRPRLRLALMAAIGVAVVGLGVLYLNRESPLVHSMPAVYRFFSSWTGGTGTTRFIAWRIAVDSWQERPIFGWGPNNFFYAFNKHYNPQSLEHGYGETWFDNAHNIILNTLAVQGLFGVLIYLGLFAMAIITLWQNKEDRQKNIHLVVLGSAFLVAHLAQNVTVFENPTSYLYFMFWLALINRLSTVVNGQSVMSQTGAEKIGKQPISQVDSVQPDKSIGSVAIICVGLSVSLLIFIFNIQPARANQKTLLALQELARNPATGIAAMREALEFNSPHIDDIRSDLSRTVIELIATQYQKIARDKLVELFDLTRDALRKNLQLHPMDIRNYLSMAQLGQIGFMLSNNQSYLAEADQYLEQALVYTPRRQQFIYMLATIKAEQGKTTDAIRLLERVMQDDPKISETYWRMAYIYKVSGNLDKARELLLEAHQKNLSFDAQGQQIEALILAPTKSGTKK